MSEFEAYQVVCITFMIEMCVTSGMKNIPIKEYYKQFTITFVRMLLYRICTPQHFNAFQHHLRVIKFSNLSSANSIK